MRGLNTKTHELYNSTANLIENADIYALTETWLTTSVYDSELFDTSYTVYRADRNFKATGTTRGGGVLLAVKSIIKSEPIMLPNHATFTDISDIDIVGTKISIGYKHINIFAVYIPPKMPANKYYSLGEAMEILEINYGSDLIILGDFNLPEYQQPGENTSRVTHINNLCAFFGLTQYNHVKNVNNHVLDLVLSTKNVTVSKSHNTILNEDSYHPALDIELYFEKSNKNIQNLQFNENLSYNFKKADFVSLYSHIINIDWLCLKQCVDVNDACDLFYEILYSLFDMYVPKTKPRNINYDPWFTHAIIKDIKKKSQIWAKFKKDKNENTYREFKNLRAKIKRDIDVSYKNYVKKIETELNSNPNNFWSYISNRKKSGAAPPTMRYQNEDVPSEQIANSFADHFAASYAFPQNQGHSLNNDHLTLNKDILNIKCVTRKNIIDAIKKLKSNLTSGPDNIPAFFIRDCSYLLVEPLEIIFNLILQTETLPDIWKISRVCPIHKNGSRSDVENYRPITIICNFPKVLEIILHNSLYNHVKNTIDEHQHGFMKGRSTSTNLVCISQFIANTLDNHSQVDVIYTDLSKAFDSLDHSILLDRLECFGVSSSLFNLIKSYLSNRFQFVQYRGYRSKNISVISGVPQGSILGPLLFNIFIDDIINIFKQHNINYLLYADDIKIYVEVRSHQDCIRMQNCLQEISQWCISSRLTLNIKKCNVMTFTRKNNYITYDYILNGISLTRPNFFKDLGVTFDRKLNFVEHYNLILTASYKCMGFIIRNSNNFTSPDTLKLLFISFVRSRLEYASVVWAPTFAIHTANIERIQRKFLKYLNFKVDGIYPPTGFDHQLLLDKFKTLSFENRRSMHSVIFLFKVINNAFDCPEILQQINFNVPRIESRSSKTFYLETPHTRLLQSSPLYRMCMNYESVQDRLDIFSCKIVDIKNKFTYSTVN